MDRGERSQRSGRVSVPCIRPRRPTHPAKSGRSPRRKNRICRAHEKNSTARWTVLLNTNVGSGSISATCEQRPDDAVQLADNRGNARLPSNKTRSPSHFLSRAGRGVQISHRDGEAARHPHVTNELFQWPRHANAQGEMHWR